MMSEALALLGGPKAFDRDLPRYSPYAEEEVAVTAEVVRSGALSGFIAAWCPEFYGGPQVRALEEAWAQYFGVKHAVSVNSLTSGLIAAVGAIGVEPGDEVIVSPWTMCASATCILVWNAIPVFADIEADTFNLDPVQVEQKITERTRAIIVPSIFGQAAKLKEIIAIARANNLKVIEDAAQSPAVNYHGKFVGAWGDIGGFSLNYHKHIHTGEGGVCVTDDDRLAERMRLIRNHGEAVVKDKGETELNNIIGFNFRLGEIEAALGRCQLKKLQQQVEQRQRHGEMLNQGLSGLRGLNVPVTQGDCGHAYYVYALTVTPALLPVTNKRIVAALRAEGLPCVADRYVTLHRYPLFTQRIAYGRSGFPWRYAGEESPVSYGEGVCPVAEDLDDNRYIGLTWCTHEFQDEDIAAIILTFKKVWKNLEALQ